MLKFESVRPAFVSGCCARQLKGIERTGEEAVELHQELKIDIVALGRLAMAAPNVVTIEVNTCERELRSAASSCVVCMLVPIQLLTVQG